MKVTLKRVVYYGVAALLFLLGMRLGTWAHSSQEQNAPREPVPAYHKTPPKGRLAPTLPPRDFPRDPVAQHAYAVASRIEPLLYQLPCYCHCDREMGHTSLLSCYLDRHASGCAVCEMEAFYAYQESRKGKTPRQIRAGIIRGDWQRVNLSHWNKPLRGKGASRK
jgi:hypothetical protein